ncbi:MAG: hypothetical protein IPN70_01065 [Candidatus Moraniibacteriota bacterium]|nr:MAG: hypothetical protein IPN70_01065 [Candidatus Moranbacteria bacterium]
MDKRIRTFFHYTYKVILYIFAIIGFILVFGFFAIRWHWTDVQGAVDLNNELFSQFSQGKDFLSEGKNLGIEGGEVSAKIGSLYTLDSKMEKISEKRRIKMKNYCEIDVIGQYFPETASKIIETYQQTDADILILKMILAAKIRIEEKNGKEIFMYCDAENIEIDDKAIDEKYVGAKGAAIFPWMDNEEWRAIKEAIVKDKDVIDKAAAIAGIESRLLVACAIVEQVRLFNSDRELFKKIFEPLKILGNANKISLGIMGIKENTAIETEKHLKDANSPYYLGVDFQNVLDFENKEGGRYARLTDDTHYYSYLYGAIYLKQIMSQWKNAGYDLQYRPEIVGTLFNVGFPQSKPKPDPKVGGSSIEVNNIQYTFGSLAYEFYYSGELTEVFPFRVN